MIAGTSLEAYEAVLADAPLLRRRCLEALNDNGPMTADEIAARLGASVLSIRPRVTELRKEGLIEPTGERRPNRSGRSANVWRANAG